MLIGTVITELHYIYIYNRGLSAIEREIFTLNRIYAEEPLLF